MVELLGMEGIPKSHNKPEAATENISLREREEYMLRLIRYINESQAMGGNDHEVEARHLLHRLQASDEPIERSYVERIIGSLGSAEDKSTNYH